VAMSAGLVEPATGPSPASVEQDEERPGGRSSAETWVSARPGRGSSSGRSGSCSPGAESPGSGWGRS
jgi:hypothetical protein